MHNGHVDRTQATGVTVASAEITTRLRLDTTGTSTASGYIINRPPMRLLLAGTSKGLATVSADLGLGRPLTGASAGRSYANAWIKVTLPDGRLEGLAMGRAIAAYLKAAVSVCIVIDYTIPVYGTEIPRREFYLCLDHEQARIGGERPTLVSSEPLDEPAPCDDCNPWLRANSQLLLAPDSVEPQPMLLAESA